MSIASSAMLEGRPKAILVRLSQRQAVKLRVR